MILPMRVISWRRGGSISKQVYGPQVRTFAASFIKGIVNKLKYRKELLISVKMTTGRPKYDIADEEIRSLVNQRFSVPKIASMVGVSVSNIRRRMKNTGSTVKSTYANLTDEELDARLREILMGHPNTGVKMMKGRLWSTYRIRVTERKLREGMKRVDPDGNEARRRANRTINRRSYYVEKFKSMYHLDTNMKLVSYGMIVKSCIDGKTRLSPYVEVSDNNTAVSSLNSFMVGVRRYGLPERTRSDRGGENVLIAELMIRSRGTNRGSHITGRSVHNQRIERFWGDLYRITGVFYNLFRELEEEGYLDIDNENHMWLLHFVYLPRINRAVEEFRRGWNHHPISTEHNRTPEQLAVIYGNEVDSNVTIDEVEGIYQALLQTSGQLPMDPILQENSIREPSRIVHSFDERTMEELLRVDVEAPPRNHGKEIYVRCIEMIMRR